jgi:pimeloyl-ACP methyl ester carboxylesterase
MSTLTPVVLVHGFWHGSWCWSAVTEELAARGVPSVAVDLDGHGLRQRSPRARWSRPFDPAAYATEPAPSAPVTASSAAATLVAQIRRIGSGRPCVVVAHSMGGTVATAAAEQAPELFAELVYLSAFAPVAGRASADYIGLPENDGDLVHTLLAADPAATGSLRIDPGAADRHAAIRETFYGDVDEPTANAATALLGVDGPFGIPGEVLNVTPERFGSVPHTYLVCRQDRAVRPALQRLFITELNAISGRPTTVVELDSSHSPFLSMPGPVADTLAAAYLTHENSPAAR